MSLHLARKILEALLPYIGTNQVSISLFRLFSYNVLVEFNMFGKEKKNGETKAVFKKKRICDAIMVSFHFFLRVY